MFLEKISCEQHELNEKNARPNGRDAPARDVGVLLAGKFLSKVLWDGVFHLPE